MKKFFISLVLLFGVTVFVPQIVMGEPTDSALPPQSIEEWKPRIVSCVSKKKEQLPKEYIGPNLKLIEVPKQYSIVTAVEFKTDANGKKVLTPVEHRSIPCDPGQSYYIDIPKTNGIETVQKESKICDCNEYLEISNSKGYEVTDIPTGSYLKLVPETLDMQVLPSTEESRKEILERQTQVINKRKEAEERQKIEMMEKAKEIEKNQKKEKTKNKIAIVLTVLGIIIGIFVKNIFKKLKK